MNSFASIFEQNDLRLILTKCKTNMTSEVKFRD